MKDPNSTDSRGFQYSQVAAGQRLIIRGLLLLFGSNVAATYVNLQYPPDGVTVGTSDWVLLAMFLLTIVGVVISIWGMVKMGRVLFSTTQTVLYCIALFIPCVSIIVLLVANQSATSYLKKHGFHVGFLGAGAKQFK